MDGTPVSGFSAIKDFAAPNTVSSFPNPFSSSIQVVGLASGNGRWQVQDGAGRILKSGALQVNENQCQISLENLEGGAYLLSISQKDQVYYLSVVKH